MDLVLQSERLGRSGHHYLDITVYTVEEAGFTGFVPVSGILPPTMMFHNKLCAGHDLS